MSSKLKSLLHKVEIPGPKGASRAIRQLASEDLLPVPPENRQWTKWSYLTFWVSYGSPGGRGNGLGFSFMSVGWRIGMTRTLTPFEPFYPPLSSPMQ